MADRWVTLDNGMKYNPDTGETTLAGTDGKLQYRYNPVTGKTTYGGTEYAGKYDPYILSMLSQQDIDKGSSQHQGFLDKEFNKLDKNPFTGSAIQGAKNAGATYGAYTLRSAYDEVRKRYQGPSFFDEVKTMDFNDQKPVDDKESQIDAIKNNSNLSPAVKEAILSKMTGQAAPQAVVKSPRPGAIFNTAPQPAATPEPTAPQQPTEPQQPMAPQQPNTPQGPDWGGLYDQISSYFTEFKNKQALGTPKQRQQISSFQQYGPAQIQRQQTPATSYGRPSYSGKGY